MKNSETSLPILKTKPHFEILDGLRGIAAFAVVIFHFMEWIFPDASKNWIGHGFLAVDFFFCLSGFVIGYAYDDRLGKMGVFNFFIARIIRLHPLVIAGSVLGLLAFLFDPFGGNAALYSVGRTLITFVCSALLIPFPVMEDRGFNLFGFNAPAWSLFWEYVANIFYALFLYRIRENYLLLLTILAGAGICFVAYRSGNLLGGWSGPTFWDGGVRIAYSFLAGLLIYRSNWIIKNKLGFLSLAVLLFIAFIVPFSKWNWFTEPLVVLLYFPLLLSLAAGAKLKPAFRNFCVFSGNISYPLYMTHYAVLWMFGNYYTGSNPNGTSLWLIVTTAVVLLVGVAYLFMVYYDLPIRKYLVTKWKEKLDRQDLKHR